MKNPMKALLLATSSTLALSSTGSSASKNPGEAVGRAAPFTIIDDLPNMTWDDVASIFDSGLLGDMPTSSKLD